MANHDAPQPVLISGKDTDRNIAFVVVDRLLVLSLHELRMRATEPFPPDKVFPTGKLTSNIDDTDFEHVSGL